ncbi:hypothetical protein [Paenibacillus popilliae]|uniref:hypothetical protein n=1 Tax=Paenibacillus popilliae TaxID=78057 RepID=UPI0003080D87|nr:hypothetical protein [Paenibacillus popilliae]
MFFKDKPRLNLIDDTDFIHFIDFLEKKFLEFPYIRNIAVTDWIISTISYNDYKFITTKHEYTIDEVIQSNKLLDIHFVKKNDSYHLFTKNKSSNEIEIYSLPEISYLWIDEFYECSNIQTAKENILSPKVWPLEEVAQLNETIDDLIAMNLLSLERVYQYDGRSIK